MNKKTTLMLTHCRPIPPVDFYSELLTEIRRISGTYTGSRS